MTDTRPTVHDALIASLSAAPWDLQGIEWPEDHERILAWAEQAAAHAQRAPLESPDVVCIAEPSWGWLSGNHLALPIAATLAACELPTYVIASSLVTDRGPVVHAGGLEAMGHTPPQNLDEARQALQCAGISLVCPSMWADGDVSPLEQAETELTEGMMACATVLAAPFRGSATTHLVTGLLPLRCADDLSAGAKHAGLSSLLMIESSSGHVEPRLDVDTRTAGFGSIGLEPGVCLRPKSYGLLVSEPDADMASSAEALAATWERALHRRKRFPPSLSVRLIVGTILAHVGRASTIMRGVGMAHQAIRTGDALARLQSFREPARASEG